MPSLTVENYLKAALQISLKRETEWVSTGELATAMNVSPGTVTSMLKTLSESGLATYKPYEGVRLTSAGRKLAMRMLRRHRLIELFLVQTLDLTWDRVHEEAENMEHAVSDLLIDRIDEYLGHPTCDPHGDPIPTSEGELRGSSDSAVPLSDCAAGTKVKFVRVIDQEADFLRYLTDAGFELGATGTVKENNPAAGIVVAQIGDRSVSMGRSAAAQLLVDRL
jgi:DtxR family Mn-dependent transcriptional regulator